MPDVFRYSIDLLLKETISLYEMGIRAIDLFAYIPTEKKDAIGSEATRNGNLIQKAIELLKREIPDMCVMVDIALDPYTDHGHDGVLNENGIIDNDSTLEILAQMSVMAGEAGADMVAPSDMMDGRIGYIRKALDSAKLQDVSILSYAVKYASSLYGPFREALNSAPKFGDKKTYQMDPANVREALLEAALDEQESADMLLVKPALPYLDVLAKLRQRTELPLAAYQVSGEYAMIMAAAEKGWLNAEKVLLESLLSIKRAGADFILTYGAVKVAKLLY
jgi:porphobilinogen synthase